MDIRAKNLPHTELSDLKRQVGFNETMKIRVMEKAAVKCQAYTDKIAGIKARIAELEATGTSK